MNNNTDLFNTIDELLSSSNRLDDLSKIEYRNSLDKIKALINTSDQFIQLHWFVSQIASETELEIVTLLTLNAFSEILNPDASSVYLLEKGRELKEICSLSKESCPESVKCMHVKDICTEFNPHYKFESLTKKCKKYNCEFKQSVPFTLYKRDGEILGYLIGYFKEKNKFDLVEKQLLMDMFCIQVGLTIENVIMKEKMQTLAFTDDLTGLSNKRVLLDKLDVEIDRYHNHKNNNQNDNGFGLIMIDVDNFKHYNDSYGHLAGDSVLEYLGELINKNITKFDTGARYGGEEMCIILPNKTIKETITFAESLCKQVEDTIFEFRKITVSLGVAHYPTDIEELYQGSYNGIIQYADTCLYHSKNTGKNKVTSSFSLKKLS